MRETPRRGPTSSEPTVTLTIHLYESSVDDSPYVRLNKNSKVLCGKFVGETHGIMSMRDFLHPTYIDSWGRNVHSAQLTPPGQKIACSITLERSVRNNIIWAKWGGFHMADLREGTFELCKQCAKDEDFALLVLAEI